MTRRRWTDTDLWIAAQLLALGVTRPAVAAVFGLSDRSFYKRMHKTHGALARGSYGDRHGLAVDGRPKVNDAAFAAAMGEARYPTFAVSAQACVLASARFQQQPASAGVTGEWDL